MIKGKKHLFFDVVQKLFVILILYNIKKKIIIIKM